MDKEQRKLVKKIITLRNRLYNDGHTNISVADILGIQPRTLSYICNGGETTPNAKKLQLYINTMEKHLQEK